MANDLAQANAAFFDELIKSYETKPHFVELQRKLTDYIQQQYAFIGVSPHDNSEHSSRPVRLLDYACGTGVITRALAPFITESAGIDVSPKMVEKFNEHAAKTAGTPTHAIVGDLLTHEDPPASLAGPEWHNFDIAAIGLGFHHFQDPEHATKRLAERLRPGGVLLIIDLVDDGSMWPTHAGHTIHKRGFVEAEMRSMFEQAGLTGFGWAAMPEKVTIQSEPDVIEKTLFLSRAVVPGGRGQ